MNQVHPPSMTKEKIEYKSSPLAKDFVLSPFSFGKNDVREH